MYHHAKFHADRCHRRRYICNLTEIKQQPIYASMLSFNWDVTLRQVQSVQNVTGKADRRSQTSRTHHTDIASTSLVAGQTTSWIQDCQLGIPSAVKQSTWLWPTIFISPQKVLLAPSGLLRKESALSLVFTVVLVTDVLLQLDHVYGTTYLPVCETRKSAAQNSENN